MRDESTSTPAPLRRESAHGLPASTDARWAACPVTVGPAALSETSQRSTMTDDFDRALDMLLTGIQAQARDDSKPAKRKR